MAIINKIKPDYPTIRDLLRDLREWFDSQPTYHTVTVTYNNAAKPSINLSRKPLAVELITCTLAATPETPVTGFTSAVSWVWGLNGVQITNLTGLSEQSQYILTFRITY